MIPLRNGSRETHGTLDADEEDQQLQRRVGSGPSNSAYEPQWVTRLYSKSILLLYVEIE
jgi:hypothetical protein